MRFWAAPRLFLTVPGGQQQPGVADLVRRARIYAGHLFDQMERMGLTFGWQSWEQLDGSRVTVYCHGDFDTGFVQARIDVTSEVVSGVILELIQEHGLLDWAEYPPVVGYTSGGTASLILESQGDDRCIIHQLAGVAERTNYVRQAQQQAPVSSWSGLMRQWVQAVYGSGRTDYTTTGGANCAITISHGGDTEWPDIPLSCWWGNTAGLMRLGEYQYLFLLAGTAGLVAIPGVLSAAGACARTWLLTHEAELSEEQIEIEEIGILGQLSPGPVAVTVTGDATWTTITGAPLAYGWQWRPDTGNKLATAKVVTLEFAETGATSQTHTLTIDATEETPTAEKSTATHASDFAISGTVALMDLGAGGALGRIGTENGTVEVSNVPLIGSWHGDTWFTEKYTGHNGGPTAQVTTMNRDLCSGSMSGESTRYTPTRSGGGSLSSTGGIGDSGYSITSQAPPQSPGGILSQAGSYTEPGTEVKSRGWPGTDTCGTKPEPPEDSSLAYSNLLEHGWATYKLTGGYVGGSTVIHQSLIPAVGDCEVWYVGQYASRETTTGITTTTFDWPAYNDYQLWEIVPGSNPIQWISHGTWNQLLGTNATYYNRSSETIAVGTITTARVSRVGSVGSGSVWEASGASSPGGSGSEAPINLGLGGLPQVDASDGWSGGGSAWTQFNAPTFGLAYNPPRAACSASGVACWEKEPGEGLYWPEPYDVASPSGDLWSWVGLAKQ